MCSAHHSPAGSRRWRRPSAARPPTSRVSTSTRGSSMDSNPMGCSGSSSRMAGRAQHRLPERARPRVPARTATWPPLHQAAAAAGQTAGPTGLRRVWRLPQARRLQCHRPCRSSSRSSSRRCRPSRAMSSDRRRPLHRNSHPTAGRSGRCRRSRLTLTGSGLRRRATLRSRRHSRPTAIHSSSASSKAAPGPE